ncbi:formyltransferase family protein [Sphaerisporangium sp. NPDC051017]|uniref:formyltransferase family protein n=1 Tax=Sphaerisporangium sp. NPDC051017 TaxID=3154636 RepID=UPI00343FB096
MRVTIPGVVGAGDLRFVYLNLRDHPRGQLMLQRLIGAGFVPWLVIDEDSPLAAAGRAGQLAELEQVAGFAPLPETAKVCAEQGIAYETVSNHNDPRVVELLTGSQLAILGDTRVLKPNIIDAVPRGIINVHPGFLPDVRGNNPYIWSVIHNLPQGVTVHLINTGVDTGPVLIARKISPAPGTTLAELVHLLNGLCADALVEALHQVVAGQAVATPQSADERLTFREARPEIRALARKMLLER